MMRGGVALTIVLSTLAGPAFANVQYRLEPVGATPLRTRFGPAELALLEKLNRRDLRHLGRATTVVVPDRFDLDELAYAPFPATWPDAEAHSTILVVDQPGQAFAAYEYGRLVRWGPVSSGARHAPTPPGLYHLNFRSKGRHSTVNPEWFMPWYFNFSNRGGLSLHQYDLPGVPASHSCVRMLERDARWLYGWGRGWSVDAEGGPIAGTGTPVVIEGAYDFGAPPPWLSPEWIARGIALPGVPPAPPPTLPPPATLPPT